MALKVEVAVDVRDMPERMHAADLALGGAGVTAWERCALGLPSIVVVLAENQRSGARALADAGGALLVESVADIAHALPACLERLREPAQLAQMSAAASRVTDGLGVERVIRALDELN
jgi:spore coat polysaccharide biosynthesis predicted glycosyltransferase SpsG